MKKRRPRYNYLALKLILIAQTIFMPWPVFSQNQLRPHSVINSYPPGPAWLEILLGKGTKAAPAGLLIDSTEAMDKYFGDGTSPAKIVMGRAAIASPFSADEIIRSMSIEDIPAEIEMFDRLIAEIREEIKKYYPIEAAESQEGLSVGEVALRSLSVYHNLVVRYLNEQKAKAQNNKDTAVFTKDAISMLELFISRDLDNASRFDLTTERIALATIRTEIEKRLATIRPLVRLADPNNPTGEEKRLIEKKAREQWQGFVGVKDEMVAMYSELEKEMEIKIDQFSRKIERLRKRNAYLEEKKEASSEKGEKMAITQIIRKNKESIRKIGDDTANTKKTREFYIIYGNYIKDVDKYMIKNWENLAQQNRTVSDIISKGICFVLEKTLKELKLSEKDGDKRMYIKVTEQLRVAEDLLGHLHGTDPFYLKAPAEKEDIILFTDKEIGTPALFKLMSGYRIKGIVSAEGTVSSHWVIVASQKKMPVVILKELKQEHKKVSDIVKVGNEIILETRKEEGKSVVMVRPDDAARFEYFLAATEQELFHKLCLDSVRGEDVKSRGMQVSIYGNAVETGDVKDILKEGGDGMGLVRTEIDLARHSSHLQGYIEDCVKEDEKTIDNKMILESPHRNTFLLEHRNTILEYIRIFKNQHGPVTIRTFDIKKDKNKDILLLMPLDERGREGFDFYRTEIGRNILIIQLTAILSALYIALRGEYNFIPMIIFPMVKTAADMQWIFDEILPLTKEETMARIKADKGRVRLMSKECKLLNNICNNIKYGPMIETAEAVDNIEPIVSNPRIKILSVGTNDLIASILTRVLEFNVTRDDEHLERFFFELRPEVLNAIEKVAKAISEWNKVNPSGIKTLGFCGEMAGREKFLLFALYLKQKYNIPIHLSMPAESMPILEYFRSYVADEDLSIFKEIEYRTEFLAAQRVDKIYLEIKGSQAYEQNVNKAIEQEKTFWRSRTDMVTTKTLPSLKALSAASSAISESA